MLDNESPKKLPEPPALEAGRASSKLEREKENDLLQNFRSSWLTYSCKNCTC